MYDYKAPRHMATPTALGLVDVQASASHPRVALRYATLVVASLTLVYAVSPLLGAYLADGRVLAASADELKAACALLVSVVVFCAGYVAQRSPRTQRSPSTQPPPYLTELDAFVEWSRAFEETEVQRLQERQTIHYSEFRFRD